MFKHPQRLGAASFVALVMAQAAPIWAQQVAAAPVRCGDALALRTRAIALAPPLPALLEAAPRVKAMAPDADHHAPVSNERRAQDANLLPARLRLSMLGQAVRDFTLMVADALLAPQTPIRALGLFANPNARPIPPALIATNSPDAEIVGEPWTGAVGVTETVADITKRGQNQPVVMRQEREEHEYPDRSGLPLNPDSPLVSQWPPLASEQDARPPRHGGRPRNPQTVGVNFFAVNISDAGYVPPDTQGDVGPSQIIVYINGHIRSFDKAGNVGALNASGDTFFNSVRASAAVDPRIRFDRTSNRWFVSSIDVNTPNNVLLAVSSGPTITGQSSFTFYKFQHDQVGPTPNSDTNGFADYDTLGVDANAVYIGVNIFGNSFTGTTGFVIRKSSVMNGGPIVVTAFRQLATSNGPGPYSPMGAHNDDPSATEGYFVGSDNASYGTLTFRRVSTPGGTPTLSGNIALTVPATYNPASVPVLGSSSRLDAIDDRLYSVQLHRDRVTGNQTLWAAHTIKVTPSGVGSSAGTRDGARWYQVGSLATTPTLVQSGTLFDGAATAQKPRWFWFPSLAMSGQGHMALGSSAAGLAERADVSAAGRFASDPLGTIQAPTIAYASASDYNPGATRWGDYTYTTVDPVDDQTIWTIQEYCDQPNSWAIRVVQLKAPAPASISSLSPSSLSQGVSGQTVIVTGTSSAGTGFFDTDATYNQAYNTHLTATVNGGGVTVASVTYNTPTQVTLTLSVDASAAPGTRTITLTNPDGQATTSAALLTITASGNSLAGSISLGLVASAPPRPVTFQFRTPGTTNVVFTKTANVDATGNYTLSGLTAGTYDIRVKADQNLAKVVANVTLSGGTTSLSATLPGGDVNNDNSVDNLDLGILAAAYASSTGEGGFDARADLNGDGSVDNLDLGILANNYAQNGDD